MRVSSLHLTFNTKEEWEGLAALGYLQRMGIQYHWDNDNYDSFDAFLMALKQSKRKNIRQERKSVIQAGLHPVKLSGDEITARHWKAFYEFYINTTGRAQCCLLWLWLC